MLPFIYRASLVRCNSLRLSALVNIRYVAQCSTDINCEKLCDIQEPCLTDKPWRERERVRGGSWSSYPEALTQHPLHYHQIHV